MLLLAERFAPVTESTEIIGTASGGGPAKVTTAVNEVAIQTTVVHLAPTTRGSGRTETPEILGAVKYSSGQPAAYGVTVDSASGLASSAIPELDAGASDVGASDVVLRSTSFTTTTTTTSAPYAQPVAPGNPF